jgi:hypothetical protein
MWLAEKRYGKDFSAQRKLVWKRGSTVKAYANPSIVLIKTELKLAQRELYDVILDTSRLRQEHLESCAKLAAEKGHETAEQAIKRIIRAEQMRITNKKISTVLGKNIKSGLSYLLIQREDGTLDTVLERDDIFDCLVQRFTAHFSQADGTPFTVPPLSACFGPFGTNTNSMDLLQGNFEVSKLDAQESVRAILDKLRYVQEKDSVPMWITSGQLRSGISIHLGHDKALLQMERPPVDSESDTRLSTRVLEMKAKFINAALEHSFVYERWKTVVNATIEKIPGRPLLHKLRVIHLMESDINLVVGIEIGRRLIRHAMASGHMSMEQFGSLPGRKAIDPLALKHMILAIARLSTTNMASFDNDAKSCFDRIVMLLA